MKYVFTAAALLLLTTAAALDHSWYPNVCCSERDCAPVSKVEHVPEGRMVTTKHGTVLVPHTFTVSPSQDNDFHACINTHPDEEGNVAPTLICFFEPMGS